MLPSNLLHVWRTVQKLFTPVAGSKPVTYYLATEVGRIRKVRQCLRLITVIDR